MRRALASLLAATGLLAPLGCRELDDPFETRTRPPVADSTLVRLTHGLGDDRLPAWTAGSDTVYYTTSRYAPLPAAPGVLLALPRTLEDAARPVLRSVQLNPDAPVWLSAPALDGGDRIAFVEIRRLGRPCDGVASCPTMGDLPALPLDSARVHVRPIDSALGLRDDVALSLHMEGRSIVQGTGGSYVVSEYHPFQYEFVLDASVAFRPSWAPDGQRLVVSDGLGLLTWRVGAGAAEPVPGTADGVLPAWSPDGRWIAYTWLERTGSTTETCEWFTTGGGGGTALQCNEERTVHYSTARVVLVRPDGSDRRVLADGREPAWSPDGSEIFFAAADGIRRVPVEGGSATPVPNATGGREPAVSPDGRWLAFARAAAGQYDVWITELP